jgi:hypothetical protein
MIINKPVVRAINEPTTLTTETQGTPNSSPIIIIIIIIILLLILLFL